jgi:hypothetical protein
MANVTGFDPAPSGQQPTDVNGNPVPVGVWGDSSTGGGVFGTSGTLPSGTSIPIDTPAGVEGHGAQGPGVVGVSPAHSGQQPVEDSVPPSPVPVGVWGDSDTWVGVFGTCGTPIPNVNDHIFQRAAIYGSGGELFIDGSDQGPVPGVVGVSSEGAAVMGLGNDGDGVCGYTFTTDSLPAGVCGQAFNSSGEIGATAGGMGVQGIGEDGAGVVGISYNVGVQGTVDDAGTGVMGESFGQGDGVYGASDSGYGVYGASDSGSGVNGVSSGANGTEGITLGDGSGVFGLHWSVDDGAGVSGVSVLGSGVEGLTFSRDPDEAAVVGYAAAPAAGGYAGLFVGNVQVTGALHKGGGGFRVDHPGDPENKYLSHSFVESPDMMNVYSGTVTTDEHGDARVALPDYFEALNRDVRYQLTAIGQFAQLMVSREINRNEFAIRSDAPRVKVCWQVTGVRHDAWAQAHHIPVEEDKPGAEKGRFLHPELFAGKDGVHRFDRRPVAAVTAALPAHLRPRAEQVLSALQATGAAQTADLTELSSEQRRWMVQRASNGRARLREQRQRANQMLERFRPGRSQQDRS